MRYLIVVMLAVGVLATPAVAAEEAPCTTVGTNASDDMNGTNEHDVVCARAGGDYVQAHDGPDTVFGARGQDTLVGGQGPDTVMGGRENDDLFAIDEKANDVIDGGSGEDSCYGDLGDVFHDCEHIVRVH